MSDRLKLFETAQKKCADLSAQYPFNRALVSIGRQIEYLIGLERQTHSDRSRLSEITIGVLTAREVEPLDEDAAEIFYKVAGEVRNM